MIWKCVTAHASSEVSAHFLVLSLVWGPVGGIAALISSDLESSSLSPSVTPEVPVGGAIADAATSEGGAAADAVAVVTAEWNHIHNADVILRLSAAN